MSLNVEHLAPSDSLFSRFDPRWKLASLMLAAGMVAALRSLDSLVVALLVSLVIVALARMPGSWFRARLALLFVSISPFFLILPFTVDRGGDSHQLLGFRLSVAGVVAAAELICKTIAIVSLMLVVLASSPLHVTFRAAQRLHVPKLFVQLSMLSYRFIHLLVEEMGRLRIALRVRGYRNRANRHSYRTVGQVTGTLLVRGVERGERVAQAMRCRGFDGQFRGLDSFRTTKRDVGLFITIVSVYAVLVAWDISR